MTPHAYDDALFRQQIPPMSDTTKYPAAALQFSWDTAVLYLSDNDNHGISGDRLQLALNLMTAHLTWSDSQLAKGKTATGVLTGSNIGGVSVSLAPPPFTNAWGAWLSTTPYGVRFRALLETASAGGWFIGGMPEGDAFRKVGGVF